MIKLVYCVRRREDVAPRDFYEYWLNQHGPKVRSVQAAIGAVRYVQSHTTAPAMNDMLVASRGLAPAYDGITEVWWNGLADLEAAMQTPAGMAAMAFLIEDEATFVDFSQSRVFMTEEHEIFG